MTPTKCECCKDSHYIKTERSGSINPDHDKPAIERCDACSSDDFTDEDAAVLAQRDGIKCCSTYPCLISA